MSDQINDVEIREKWKKHVKDWLDQFLVNQTDTFGTLWMGPNRGYVSASFVVPDVIAEINPCTRALVVLWIQHFLTGLEGRWKIQGAEAPRSSLTTWVEPREGVFYQCEIESHPPGHDSRSHGRIMPCYAKRLAAFDPCTKSSLANENIQTLLDWASFRCNTEDHRAHANGDDLLTVKQTLTFQPSVLAEETVYQAWRLNCEDGNFIYIVWIMHGETWTSPACEWIDRNNNNMSLPIHRQVFSEIRIIRPYSPVFGDSGDNFTNIVSSWHDATIPRACEIWNGLSDSYIFYKAPEIRNLLFPPVPKRTYCSTVPQFEQVLGKATFYRLCPPGTECFVLRSGEKWSFFDMNYALLHGAIPGKVDFVYFGYWNAFFETAFVTHFNTASGWISLPEEMEDTPSLPEDMEDTTRARTHRIVSLVHRSFHLPAPLGYRKKTALDSSAEIVEKEKSVIAESLPKDFLKHIEFGLTILDELGNEICSFLPIRGSAPKFPMFIYSVVADDFSSRLFYGIACGDNHNMDFPVSASIIPKRIQDTLLSSSHVIVGVEFDLWDCTVNRLSWGPSVFLDYLNEVHMGCFSERSRLGLDQWMWKMGINKFHMLATVEENSVSWSFRDRTISTSVGDASDIIYFPFKDTDKTKLRSYFLDRMRSIAVIREKHKNFVFTVIVSFWACIGQPYRHLETQYGNRHSPNAPGIHISDFQTVDSTSPLLATTKFVSFQEYHHLADLTNPKHLGATPFFSLNLATELLSRSSTPYQSPVSTNLP